MTTGPLTQQQILAAAEEVLRRYGPAKTTVVDVARQLGVSHGSVYRHFPSKAALRDAVAAGWLERIVEPLTEIVDGPGSASQRLRDWVVALSDIKHELAGSDPELFDTYVGLAIEARGVVAAHESHLAGQLATIITDGARTGEFAVDDPERAGWSVFRATARFHHPAHAAEWVRPEIAAEIDELCDLLLRGLAAG